MPRSIAIVGGGIAGLSAAYQLRLRQQAGSSFSFTLIEASERLGGIVETHREDGFVMECGPDGWVTEKPWARELAEELGLAGDLIASNDETRVTWVLQRGKLVQVPDGMRMMVPERLDALHGSPLFSPAALSAYAAEPGRAEDLKASARPHDESIASFVERHFGGEVLRVLAAPLLGGVFGGDVQRLSVRAVMQPFVQMERDHGSLILALQTRTAQGGTAPRQSTFTSLRDGMETLTERLVATIPSSAIQMNTRVSAMQRMANGWLLSCSTGGETAFDHVLLATPVKQTRNLLRATGEHVSELLNLPASSAVIVAFAFTSTDAPAFPKGFGFLVPEGEGSPLLAATFADQKFPGRVPEGGKLVRAYFGGASADALMPSTDAEIAALALRELTNVLGALPSPHTTVVRRWPDALPQYEVGHIERMQELDRRVDAIGALHLLGNAYRGVGLPDLIRDARAAARTMIVS